MYRKSDISEFLSNQGTHYVYFYSIDEVMEDVRDMQRIVDLLNSV